MSRVQLISKMCSQLWTANILTLAQLLLLLFVGTCFSNVTVASNNQITTFVNTNTMSIRSLFTNTLNRTSTLSPIQTISDFIPLSTVSLTKRTTVEQYESTTPYVSTKTPHTTVNSKVVKVIVKEDTRNKSHQPVPTTHVITKTSDKIGVIDCDLPILPKESRLWRGNETHELNLPVKV